MNIVILDGYLINPGDLNWKEIHALGNCTVYDRTHPQEVLERAAEAEIILTNKVVLRKEMLRQLPKLRYIGVLATGYNIIDVDAAKERGIIVTNVPAYSTMSVAQTVFALLLELTHHTASHSEAVRSGEWSASIDFAFWKYPLVELAGKTMGIIGFGNIGQAAAKIAFAFGMQVLVSTRTPEKYQQWMSYSENKISFVSQEEVFRKSDVVSIHCPLTEATKNLVNEKTLSQMKPSAFLINTSRGGVIDEQALADALNQEKIAGAGLDVLSKEPPPLTNPLLSAKNCVITPHIAWAALAARERLITAAIENLKAFLNGAPVNVVNK